MAAEPTADAPVPARHRPRTLTVFVAAFTAGAALAVGVNRFLDIRLAQSRPQVECEPIFVVLRSLPQGAPVTVWDVALRDWPKAGMPTSALRATDSFEGCVLKHAVREGQPLLSVQLVHGGGEAGQGVANEEPFTPPPAAPASAQADDLWLPAATAATPTAPSRPSAAETIATTPAVAEPVAEPADEPGVADTAEAVTSPQPIAAPERTATSEVAATPADTVATPAAEPTEPTETTTQTETEIDAMPVETAASPPPEPAPPAAPDATETAEIPTTTTRPTQPAASAPTPAAVPEGRQPPPRLAADLDPPPAAVDAESLPSVMARSEETASADDAAPAGERIRYLVVPERIARQADTSFTTPTATPPQDEPVASTEARPTATTTQRQQSQAAAPPARKPSPPAATRTKPAPARTAPAKQPQPTQERRPLGPRAWGAVFPNVSAGLESIGGWRGRDRENVAEDRPNDPQPARR